MGVLLEVMPLALLDAISISTLVIPIWFLLTPAVLRVPFVHAYLGLVAAGYLGIGLLLLEGVDAARAGLRGVLDSTTGQAVLVVAGLTLVASGLWHGLRRPTRPSREGLGRWRERAVGESASIQAVALVAVAAVSLEVATMFPYLLAIDTLDRSGLSWPRQASVLALYCLVMIGPALVMTVLRTWWRRTAAPVLRAVDDWLRRNEREDTAWLLALAGVLVLSVTEPFRRLLGYLE